MATVTSATTAKLLGSLHKELLAEELPDDIVREVVLMGAKEVLEQSGFCVEEVSA